MQGAPLAVDPEHSLALEKAVVDLACRMNYMGDYMGVENVRGGDSSMLEKRMSALEHKMSPLQAPSSLERKSASLVIFAKYLIFFAWIREVQRQAGEGTMAERRDRRRLREESKLRKPIVGVSGPYRPLQAPHKKLQEPKASSVGSKGGKSRFDIEKSGVNMKKPAYQKRKASPAGESGKGRWGM